MDAYEEAVRSVARAAPTHIEAGGMAKDLVDATWTPLLDDLDRRLSDDPTLDDLRRLVNRWMKMSR